MVPFVGVVGPGRVDADRDGHLLAGAERVGAGLAAQGAVVVCGGLGGVMEAACRGATETGGLTIGILPGEDRAAANRYVQIPIATGIGELRNGLVVRTSDALIAVGGAYGTLSEIALGLRSGRTVVGLGSWHLVHPGGETDRGMLVAQSPEDAVAIAMSAATGGP